MSATAPERAARRVGARSLRRVVFPEEQIRERVRNLGAEIGAHYPDDEELVVLGLLKGSFIFMADLVRNIRRPLHVDFLVASSYGKGSESSGEVKLHHVPETTFGERHLLIVEDIIDSGTTLRTLVPALGERGARSVEVCALLHKRLVTLEPEARWVGFDCPDEFVVGYGLDHAEDFRHLPFIGSI